MLIACKLEHYYILLMYFLFRKLSEDEEFVDELRGTIRFFASVVLRRAKKVKICVICPALLVIHSISG